MTYFRSGSGPIPPESKNSRLLSRFTGIHPCRGRADPPAGDIAATCLFLVSEDGGFITGQTIHVNGAHYY
jgi:NAD(P)-dependent dehydrogenase (short-subunit alcohol dehydrogenase family)